jgi:hypothetical protein
MRLFTGTIVTIIILTGATLTVLALWGITPIEWTHIWKTGITIAIVCITAVILWLVKVLFFKKDPFNVRKQSKNTLL